MEKDRIQTSRQERDVLKVMTLVLQSQRTQAIGYVLRQWKELTVFAKDGAVPIDNNVSEREMKQIVLSRKNSLFVGNELGGHTAAILASFTSTRRRHDIDPRAYLTQLLTNLPNTPLSQLEAWLPDRWKRTQLQPDTS
jgi:hypothetical protein